MCRTTRFSYKCPNDYALHSKVIYASPCTISGAENDCATVELTAMIFTHLNYLAVIIIQGWMKEDLLGLFLILYYGTVLLCKLSDTDGGAVDEYPSCDCFERLPEQLQPQYKAA